MAKILHILKTNELLLQEQGYIQKKATRCGSLYNLFDKNH